MTVVLYLIVVVVIVTIIYLLNSLKRPPKYPPGPKWWPYVGNTYELRKLSRQLGGQFAVFEKWSKEFNTNVLGLKLGQEYVVVGLTYEIVRQIHTREEFEGRPDNFFMRLRTMGTRLGITCTDGPLWNEHRNFTARHLRRAGYGRETMDMHIENEANELISVIKCFNGQSVWPGSFLAPSVINVLWSLAAGKRINRNDKRLQRLIQLLEKRSKLFDLCGGLLTQMPWLRFIAPEKTGYNLIKRFNKELDEFFMETINEHKQNYSEEKANDDLIYAYIKEINEGNGIHNDTYTDRQLTMTILDIFIAGAQTTSNTLDLALMMMIIKPEICEKIRQEIQTAASSHSVVRKSEKLETKIKLPYVEAVLMEVQRYFHIIPITGPRRTLRTTQLGDYTIPKNTTILIGLQSVLMDHEHWEDPENFRPERFLCEKGEIISNEYFMPFGQGKRRCLGDSLARACLQEFFVKILSNFKLELDENDIIPSTHLQPGITLSPKPYKIIFKPY